MSIEKAAELIKNADALIISAGAGMGIDSGLPDYRGEKGFWKDYPPAEKLGVDYYKLANPKWFVTNPRLAWGFKGHTIKMYRDVVPHNGFHILKKWSDSKKHGGFVFTSNVDSEFQKVGFPESSIMECHGSVEYLQCMNLCHYGIWQIENPLTFDIDQDTFEAVGELPSCPFCKGLARPNVLMFSDFSWLEGRALEQRENMFQWFREIEGSRVVVIECGAGNSIPTVRKFSQRKAIQFQGHLIRINPSEEEVPEGDRFISIKGKALETLEELDRKISDV